MSPPINILVTGANRGLGKATCQAILNRHDLSALQLYAASRKGEDVGLASRTQLQRVEYPQLDVSDTRSIRMLVKQVRESTGNIDVLINNAGILLDKEYSLENAKQTLEVNYRGTVNMCNHFIPMMASGARIVNISSISSSLLPYEEHIRSRFRNPDASFEDLEELVDEYLRSVSEGVESTSGFGGPGYSYNVSKALVNAATRIFARENPSLLINACCPGWVATDMGVRVREGNAPKTPEEGATIPIRLAFDEINGVSGKYWANSSVKSTANGKVRNW